MSSPAAAGAEPTFRCFCDRGDPSADTGSSAPSAMLCVGRGIGAGDVGGDESLLVDHVEEDELVQIDAAWPPGLHGVNALADVLERRATEDIFFSISRPGIKISGLPI
jgi:hypothetical protein